MPYPSAVHVGTCRDTGDGGWGTGGPGMRPPKKWDISYPYSDQGGQIMPAILLLAPPSFWPMRRLCILDQWVKNCDFRSEKLFYQQFNSTLLFQRYQCCFPPKGMNSRILFFFSSAHEKIHVLFL